MGVLDLLARAKSAGLTVETNGDKLKVKGPKSAEPLALELLAHKPEVMAALHPPINAQGTIGIEGAEPDYIEIAPPAPCPRCGSTAAWWNREGDQRCMACNPPLVALRALESAERIRRRLGIENSSAAELRHDLRLLVGV